MTSEIHFLCDKILSEKECHIFYITYRYILILKSPNNCLKSSSIRNNYKSPHSSRTGHHQPCFSGPSGIVEKGCLTVLILITSRDLVHGSGPILQY